MGATADKSVLDRLYDLAERQAGYFTAGQAVDAGVSRRLLSHHSAGGPLIHAERGLYRLRNFPGSPHEGLVATWLAVGRQVDAVISHDSALDLYDLSDIIPTAVHLTSSRAYRGHRGGRRPGVRLHFVTGGVPPRDRAERKGLPITSVERTLLDSLAMHGVTEQTELATAEALDRGLTSPRRLKARAAQGPKAGQKRLRQALGDKA